MMSGPPLRGGGVLRLLFRRLCRRGGAVAGSDAHGVAAALPAQVSGTQGTAAQPPVEVPYVPLVTLAPPPLVVKAAAQLSPPPEAGASGTQGPTSTVRPVSEAQGPADVVMAPATPPSVARPAAAGAPPPEARPLPPLQVKASPTRQRAVDEPTVPEVPPPAVPPVRPEGAYQGLFAARDVRGEAVSGRLVVGDTVYTSSKARAVQDAAVAAKEEAIRQAAAPKMAHVSQREYLEHFRRQEQEGPERFRALQAGPGEGGAGQRDKVPPPGLTGRTVPGGPWVPLAPASGVG